ncbi:hypothetical protein BT69DRAFT_1352380 [Atractiella rhizophila]|nr:hypothetical protein BT69DRAFT_1352380 [Atractiella rhizophila]
MEAAVSEFLAKLGIQDPDTTSYLLGLIQEDSFAFDEKVEALCGSIDESQRGEVSEEELKTRIEELVRHCEEIGKLQPVSDIDIVDDQGDEKAEQNASASVSTADDARARIISQYAALEESSDEEEDASEAAATMRNLALTELERESKMGKKAKKREKEARGQMDLLNMPNLNTAKVDAERERKRREEAERQAAKKAKDKSDRKKQLDDEKRKLEERRKKAQKGERRA